MFNLSNYLTTMNLSSKVIFNIKTLKFSLFNYLISMNYLSKFILIKKKEVLPRFELGSTDSKSDVLTVTP